MTNIIHFREKASCETYTSRETQQSFLLPSLSTRIVRRDTRRHCHDGANAFLTVAIQVTVRFREKATRETQTSLYRKALVRELSVATRDLVSGESQKGTLWVPFCDSGGDNGARTRDLLTASQALSQLSYTPEFIHI